MERIVAVFLGVTRGNLGWRYSSVRKLSFWSRRFIGLILAIAIVFSMSSVSGTVLAAPTQDMDVSFNVACAFQNDLSLVYYCKINSPGDFTNIRLRISYQKFTGAGGSFNWQDSVITDYTYDADTGNYRFVFRGIAAAEMSNTVKASFCADIGNQAYQCDASDFSIKQYAEAVLSYYSSSTKEEDQKLCTLMVDMLNYGAAAQTHFQRNLNNLANKDLTDAQRALGSPALESTSSSLKHTALPDAVVFFKTVKLVFRNTVDLVISVQSDYEPADQVYAQMSYTTVKGKTATVKVGADAFVYNASTGMYDITFNSLSALYFSSPLTFTLKYDNTVISATLQYSYETYVNAILNGDFPDAMKDLAIAMLVYGNAAKEYFTATQGGSSSGGGSGSGTGTDVGDIEVPSDPDFSAIHTYKNSVYTEDMPTATIVIPQAATAEDQYAAALLQRFILEEDGYEPSVISDSEAQGSHGFEISVGNTNRPHGELAYSSEDAYKIKSYDNGIALFGNGSRGTIDAAMKFLSICGGYFWLSYEDGYRTNQEHFKYSSSIDLEHERAFIFSDVDTIFGQTHKGDNRLYSLANGLNGFYVNLTVSDQPGYEKWYLSKAAPGAYGDLQPGQAHTLMAEYVTKDNFDAHPEWFSLWKGSRETKQLCLTNPEVYEKIREHVFEILESEKYDPNAPMQILSLSQADNDAYCQCSNCTQFRKDHEASTDQQGLCDAALYLDLCNRISAEVKAAGYTNVYIDMLAYTYNLKPPVNITVDDHVIVRYAAIHRCYAHNCDDAEHCQRAKEDIAYLTSWANLCNKGGGQLWIWDYNINFACTAGPYMNLYSMPHDIKYYKDIGVKGIYLQSNDAHNSMNSEFGDLRNYLSGVFLENPDADLEKEMKFFVYEFYGEAGQYILQAIDLMEAQAKRHEAGPNCYASKYYWRGHCMTYDSYTSAVFANVYPTKMDAHNEMPQEDLQMCEALWNKALEVAAGDTERHKYTVNRTHLCWRWTKSCMKVYEFSDPDTYLERNTELYTDLYTTYGLPFYSLIQRKKPGKAYLSHTPDRWINTKAWEELQDYAHLNQDG